MRWRFRKILLSNQFKVEKLILTHANYHKEQPYQFLTAAVITMPIDALFKSHLNVMIIDKHDAFIESIVTHTAISGSS